MSLSERIQKVMLKPHYDRTPRLQSGVGGGVSLRVHEVQQGVRELRLCAEEEGVRELRSSSVEKGVRELRSSAGEQGVRKFCSSAEYGVRELGSSTRVHVDLNHNNLF